MKEALIEFLSSLTGNARVTVALFSMFPLVELKGAIPVGEALGLGLWRSALLSYIGSTLVAVPVFFLLTPVFNLLKRWKFIAGLVERTENVFRRRAEKIAEKSGDKAEKKARAIMGLGIFAFVAIPLPLTGVWTGTAVAVFLGMKFRELILPVTLGNFTAGAAIAVLTFFFRDYVEYIILGLFALVIIMLVVFIVKVALSGKEEKKE